MAKIKWINEGGVFYPVSGDVVLHSTPGPGIFTIVMKNTPGSKELGLRLLSDKFTFPEGKLYDLGSQKLREKIKKYWWSEQSITERRSLGVIFNGIKGSGKTVEGKKLCNLLDLPVIIVDNSYDGMILGFLREIQFDAIIFVDEAEKIFKLGDEDDILLRMIDSVSTGETGRKLFILTTNTLSLNSNLLGRTQRIRYILNFKNLPSEVVNEYVDDNLKPEYAHLKKNILEKVDLLEISTIDLLKGIVDEVNITGECDSPEEDLMNIPLSRYTYTVLELKGCSSEDIQKVKDIIKKNLPDGMAVYEWLKGTHKETDSDGKEEEYSNESILEALDFIDYVYPAKMKSQYSAIWRDSETSLGYILTEPDDYGIFTYKDNYDKEDHVAILLGKSSNPSLYRSSLLY